YKYEKDYQVEAILDGQVKEAVYSRLERAPFDERMSVISLVLAALNSGFQSLQEKGRRLERLEKIFRRLKPKGMKGTDAGGEDAGRTEYDSPAEYLAGLTAGMQAERKYKLESKLLSRKEDYLYQDVTAVLEKVLQVIKAESRQTEEEVWEKVSEIFDAENEAYEVLFELCGGRLEHAFDFMEAAFGSGQEMVVFVTGLNTGFYSVDFLQEYECQRYYQYNKMLLFDDREREILKQMES
ncbi:MAG: ATPase, partial [Hungatella sp.]|nr:ATPase [Hungatella sp.]